jgi:hypothetical protein
MVMVLSPKKKEVKLDKPKAVKPRVEKAARDAVTAESDVSSVVSTEGLTAETEE